MLPLVLDLSRLTIILVGEGEAALRRLALLEAAGAVALTVHAETPSAMLIKAAGGRLIRRLPNPAELAAARLVFLSDRDAPYGPALAAAARGAGALVHVEDAPGLGDVQAPAVLRRGDLTIAVSTGGKSPSLAVLVKRFLAARFGAEWQERLDALAARRRGWRASGADARTVARWSEAWLERNGWLPAETISPAAGARPRLAAGR
jgi:precorrin-2 dehydrogenase/sirohydrochlorin ferrochelatase